MVHQQVDLQQFLSVAQRYAQRTFRGPAREELISDTISEAWELLRTAPPYATPSNIAHYAVARVKVRRQFAESVRSVTGPKSRTKVKPGREDFDVTELAETGENPADLAALRVDFTAWLSLLNHRQHQVLLAVLTGERTDHIAEQLGISPGRVSQLRRELIASWEEFTG